MDICTISKLANEAGVSVYVVCDSVLRGLVHPARRSESGYGLYDDRALERLRFVRALFEVGVGLDELTTGPWRQRCRRISGARACANCRAIRGPVHAGRAAGVRDFSC